MHLNALLGLLCALLAVRASALSLESRGTCLKDKCQKAVNAGPKNLYGIRPASAARKDCSSFLAKTVTPCPVTTTKTVTSFRTARTVTAFVSVTTKKTATDRTTITLPITTTITPTTTETLTDTSFFTVLTTVTQTTTTTYPVVIQTEGVTQTSVVFQPARRAVPTIIPGRYEEEDTEDIEARGVAKCPTVKKATKIPSYADSCKKPAAYSSACACLGVKCSTTTLPAVRVTKTKTITKTKTPTRTATTTVAKTTTTEFTKTISTTITLIGEEETVTKTAPLSVTTTVTSTVTELSSVVPKSLVTSTTVVTVPTTCPQFILQAVGGPIDGQFVLSQGDTEKLAFTGTRANAATFQINSSGQLVTGNNLIANINNRSLYYVYLETQSRINAAGYLALTCQKTPLLTCQTSNGQTRFAVCVIIGPGTPSAGPALLFGTTDTPDCSYISLRTLPGPQCP